MYPRSSRLSLGTEDERRYAFLSLAVAMQACTVALIIKYVAYTEIDWETYMIQVNHFLRGERDYTNIEGPTGPCVYPAFFLYSFSALSYITGPDIAVAQIAFGAIYLCTLAVVLWVSDANKTEKALSVLLLLSKRLLSIYCLRMFNDCVSMLLAFIACAFFTKRKFFAGSTFFSLAVGTKMNVLLMAPGLLYVLLKERGFLGALLQIAYMGVIQLVLLLPFALDATHVWHYIKSAFNLGRIFLFKWSVNYQFLPEDIFVSPYFSLVLLVLMVCVMVRFFTAYDWDILEALWISNFIGVVFSRSLHFQFYCWYAWTLPFIIGRASWGIQNSWIRFGVRAAVFLIIEFCYNVPKFFGGSYDNPSTWWSSLLLQCAHFFILIGVAKDAVARKEAGKKQK
eukprot:GEMP01036163.1.p1 GENE.GEMP01036163.1~~GEMP01036163.1.p1  ORF type:complete len:396 (+),score=50.71 GEMP01036163.1:130-1317(+)